MLYLFLVYIKHWIIFMNLILPALVFTFFYLSSSLKVEPNNTLFVDQYGRYRIYHGVNAVYKTYPFHPNLQDFSTNYSLTDHDLFNLKHWGMNVIRLHAAWEGVQPQKGVYNYTYVETLRQIVQKCNRFGISVVLDAHQDLFARQFCGQGLPTWVAKRESFPAPLKVKIRYDQHGFPLRQDCLSIQFGQFYLTYDVMKLQKDLFTNQRGLLDHFCKFWQIVAAYLSTQPNLLGYQFINEPIGMDAYLDPAGTLLPGEVNDKYLLPAYKRILASIRKYDRHTPIFFQPSTVDIFGGGFFQTPGGQSQLQTQVYSYHIYCPYVTKLGEPVVHRFCQAFDALTAASKQQNIRQLKIGGFLTEYGALSNSNKSAQQITTITDLMQLYFRSWTYWQFKYYDDITTAANPGTTESFYDQYGNLQQNKVRALSRPYAYAICGIPISETLKNGVFSLNWVINDDCFNKKTQLFLSQSFYYPKGMQVKFSKNCVDCWIGLMKGESVNLYQVHASKKSLGRKVSVSISPK